VVVLLKHNGFLLDVFEEGFVIPKPRRGPRILFIELTTECNLNCKMCFRRTMTEPRGFMDEKLFKKILNDAEECGVDFIWFGGWGEPTYHPKFLEFAEDVKSRGFKLGINTNGTLLSPDYAEKLVKLGVDRITISIDAAMPQTYAEIRGGVLKNILSATSLIHGMKKSIGTLYPILEFSYVMMKSNADEVLKLFEIAEKHGVGRIIISNVIPISESLVSECIYGNSFNYERIVEKIAIKTLETNVGAAVPEFELKTERRCLFIENNACCVTWNGEVTPCYNFLHNYIAYVYGVRKEMKQISFGNIKDKSLGEIWRSPEYQKFRFKVRYFKFPSCTDCKFHDICDFATSNLMDCWGNEPSCADCLFSRGIVQCPL